MLYQIAIMDIELNCYWLFLFVNILYLERSSPFHFYLINFLERKILFYGNGFLMSF